MQWDCPNPFITDIIVSPNDIDGLGHANNSAYIKWAEKAAWLHNDDLGLSLADYHQHDRAMAISKANYDYLLPCFAHQQLTMATWISACDSKLQVERSFQLTRDNKTVFTGRWITTCVRLSSGKIARMPKVFIATYGAAVQSFAL